MQSEKGASEPAEGDDPFAAKGKPRILTDPSDLDQRDVCLSMWYLAQERVMREHGELTGHPFGPVSKPRSPVAILEEQLAFMREFLAESERLKALERAERDGAEPVPEEPDAPEGDGDSPD